MSSSLKMKLALVREYEKVLQLTDERVIQLTDDIESFGEKYKTAFKEGDSDILAGMPDELEALQQTLNELTIAYADNINAKIELLEDEHERRLELLEAEKEARLKALEAETEAAKESYSAQKDAKLGQLEDTYNLKLILPFSQIRILLFMKT